MTPKMFCALDGNNSKMAKDKDFKFGTHAPRDSPLMTPDTLIFWPMNANSPRMAKAMDSKYGNGKYVCTESWHEAFIKFLKNGVSPDHVTTDPEIYDG